MELPPIKRTFCHVHGVGKYIEQRLWDSGILSWEDAIGAPTAILSPGLWRDIVKTCQESLIRYEKGDYGYFSSKLIPGEHWRVFASFPGTPAYIDIETTNTSIENNFITVIGLYDSETVFCFLNDFSDLRSARPPINPGRYHTVIQPMSRFADKMNTVAKYVTFNGRVFDVPIMKHHFTDADFDKPHLDLKFAFTSIGMKGGLKKLERELGLQRPDKVTGLSGFDAVNLWNRYRNNNDLSALATLIEYNVQDIVNLLPLTERFMSIRVKHFPQPVKLLC